MHISIKKISVAFGEFMKGLIHFHPKAYVKKYNLEREFL